MDSQEHGTVNQPASHQDGTDRRGHCLQDFRNMLSGFREPDPLGLVRMSGAKHSTRFSHEVHQASPAPVSGREAQCGQGLTYQAKCPVA